jgi:hypothetical protein
MLVDSNEQLPPQTLSFKATMRATAAAPTFVPPQPEQETNYLLVVVILLLAITMIVVALLRSASPRQEPRLEKFKARIRKVDILAEKPVQRTSSQKFSLRNARSPAWLENKEDIKVPSKPSQPAPAKPVQKEPLKSVSVEQLPPSQSTKQVLDEITAALKELAPKYDWKKQGGKKH